MPIQTAGISAGTVIQMPKAGRKVRSPRHDWHLRHRPYQLQPFLCAPVLPGETMKNALVQFSALSDPIKNPLIGWWLEHYLFYVPFRAMSISDHLETMVLDPAFGELNAAGDVAAKTAYYHAQAGDPSWAYWATEAVVLSKFRNEGEAFADATTGLDGLPQIGLINGRWTESMILDANVSAEPDTVPGQYDQDGVLENSLGSGATNFNAAYDAYQSLVAAKLVDVTYEDWLRTYGVRMPKPNDEPEPELLRYSKDWKYPGQTVDAADGSVAAALKWRDAFRADKDRRFKEPGVILGLTCATPKVYMSKQVQAVIDSMKTSLDWLPAVLADQAFTSLKKFTSDGATAGNGPLGMTPSGDYWVDLRDLFTGGDQFVNFSLAEDDAGLVALPSSTLQRRFVTAADVDALFTNAAGGANLVHQDGVCQFAIMGNVTDYTP